MNYKDESGTFKNLRIKMQTFQISKLQFSLCLAIHVYKPTIQDWAFELWAYSVYPYLTA